MKMENKLPPLPGIDVVQALDNLDGDAVLLLQLLRSFTADKRESIATLTDALDRREWRTGERVAHGVKGIAGYIAAEPLLWVATRMEQACEQGDGATARGLLTEFGARLTEIFAAAEILARACPELDSTPAP